MPVRGEGEGEGEGDASLGDTFLRTHRAARFLAGILLIFLSLPSPAFALPLRVSATTYTHDPSGRLTPLERRQLRIFANILAGLW